MIARQTVGEVLAEPRGGEDVAPVVVAGAGQAGSARLSGADGLAPEVLAPDYQQIMDVFAISRGRAARRATPVRLAGACAANLRDPDSARIRAEFLRLVRLGAYGLCCRSFSTSRVCSTFLGQPPPRVSAVRADRDMGRRD